MEAAAWHGPQPCPVLWTQGEFLGNGRNRSMRAVLRNILQGSRKLFLIFSFVQKLSYKPLQIQGEKISKRAEYNTMIVDR